MLPKLLFSYFLMRWLQIAIPVILGVVTNLMRMVGLMTRADLVVFPTLVYRALQSQPRRSVGLAAAGITTAVCWMSPQFLHLVDVAQFLVAVCAPASLFLECASIVIAAAKFSDWVADTCQKPEAGTLRIGILVLAASQVAGSLFCLWMAGCWISWVHLALMVITVLHNVIEEHGVISGATTAALFGAGCVMLGCRGGLAASFAVGYALSPVALGFAAPELWPIILLGSLGPLDIKYRSWQGPLTLILSMAELGIYKRWQERQQDSSNKLF